MDLFFRAVEEEKDNEIKMKKKLEKYLNHKITHLENWKNPIEFLKLNKEIE